MAIFKHGVNGERLVSTGVYLPEKVLRQLDQALLEVGYNRDELVLSAIKLYLKGRRSKINAEILENREQSELGVLDLFRKIDNGKTNGK